MKNLIKKIFQKKDKEKGKMNNEEKMNEKKSTGIHSILKPVESFGHPSLKDNHHDD